jgi:hypothetical protein
LSSGAIFKEATMNRAKLSAKGLLLISGIGVAAAALAGPALAAAQPSSGTSIPTTVVIRGSDPAAAQPSSSKSKDIPPIVLRGSPPSAAQPLAAQYACPSGYDYDPSFGCVTPGYSYNPYDYGDWPYYGFDRFSSVGRRHGFHHGFAHGIGQGLAPLVSRRLASGFVHGFAHTGGFGRR